MRFTRGRVNDASCTSPQHIVNPCWENNSPTDTWVYEYMSYCFFIVQPSSQFVNLGLSLFSLGHQFLFACLGKPGNKKGRNVPRLAWGRMPEKGRAHLHPPSRLLYFLPEGPPITVGSEDRRKNRTPLPPRNDAMELTPFDKKNAGQSYDFRASWWSSSTV